MVYFVLVLDVCLKMGYNGFCYVVVVVFVWEAVGVQVGPNSS